MRLPLAIPDGCYAVCWACPWCQRRQIFGVAADNQGAWSLVDWAVRTPVGRCPCMGEQPDPEYDAQFCPYPEIVAYDAEGQSWMRGQGYIADEQRPGHWPLAEGQPPAREPVDLNYANACALVAASAPVSHSGPGAGIPGEGANDATA